MEAKELVLSALSQAQSNLEEALCELEKMPAFDVGSVAFVAHTLSNYLNVTGGTLELILMYLRDHPDAQIKLGIEALQHSTNLMAHAVSQLMNVSVDMETKLRFEKVDLTTLVQRACNYYQRLADRKTIRIIASANTDVPVVWTDRIAVAAVLDNLLSNAVKYSPFGRQICVQVRGEKDWAVCSVRDEGPGLSQEDQAMLFQRGIRLTPKPTGEESSLGYGLAVTKELVGQLHGQIWCESVLGQGSSFSFRLPTYQEQMPYSTGQQNIS